MGPALLKANRRISWVFLLFGLVLLATAVGGITISQQWIDDPPVARQRAVMWVIVGVALVLAAAGFWLVMTAARFFLRPRIGLRPDRLLVYVRGWRPYELPLDVVECFFIGQHAAGLATATRSGAPASRV